MARACRAGSEAGYDSGSDAGVQGVTSGMARRSGRRRTARQFVGTDWVADGHDVSALYIAVGVACKGGGHKAGKVIGAVRRVTPVHLVHLAHRGALEYLILWLGREA